MEKLKLDLLKKEEAKMLHIHLLGWLPQNKILVAAIGEDNKTQSGIILAKTEENSTLPKQGVVVAKGSFSEDCQTYRDINIGDVVTHGIYGGKEVNPLFTEFADYEKELMGDRSIMEIVSKYKFMVLSVNEVVYVDQNIKY